MDILNENNESITASVSRSGRIIKKSTKLLDYQSPDEVEKQLKRSIKTTPAIQSVVTGRRGRPRRIHTEDFDVNLVNLTTNENEEENLANIMNMENDLASEIANLVTDANDLTLDVGLLSNTTTNLPQTDNNNDTFFEQFLNATTNAVDSEDELDTLVADLVEGVQAESLEQNKHLESKVRESLYMTEKANKRKILRDGQIITGKLQRKDKGKSRFTAYSLWAREFRKTIKFTKNNDLSELWSNVSNKEKTSWRRKAKLQAKRAKAREKNNIDEWTSSSSPEKSNTTITTTPINANTYNTAFLNRATTSRTKKLAAAAAAAEQIKQQTTTNAPTNKRRRTKEQTVPTTTIPEEKQKLQPQQQQQNINNIKAIDTAAHLKLLGESLTIIGKRLKEHDGQIAVAGSLSVLLDSLLCSMGPLLCLTTYIPGLENQPQLEQNLAAILDNIAYVMPVQSQVIPYILKVHKEKVNNRLKDICVCTPTGSGKTFAYAIPIVQILEKRLVPQLQALIVVPVAELAIQVFKIFLKLCAGTELKVAVIDKFSSFAHEQATLVDTKIDIVVATPGRLVDHLNKTKGFSLQHLKFLVIDEADRIIDTMFHNWLMHYEKHTQEHINTNTTNYITMCNKEVQQIPYKMLFSATLTTDPERFKSLHLLNPKFFANVPIAAHVGKNVEKVKLYKMPHNLIQKYCITEVNWKPLTLFGIIKQNKWKRFMCFANNNQTANRLTFILTKIALNKELTFTELSSNLTPKERNKSLKDFINGKINGLICSDAMARGIDIQNVDAILSYDMPRHIKTYVHRVGRTARAHSVGTAVTLLSANELLTFKNMLSKSNENVTEDWNLAADDTILQTYTEQYLKAKMALQGEIAKEKREKTVSKIRAEEKEKLTEIKTSENKTKSLMHQIQDKLQTM